MNQFNILSAQGMPANIMAGVLAAAFGLAIVLTVRKLLS